MSGLLTGWVGLQLARLHVTPSVHFVQFHKLLGRSAAELAPDALSNLFCVFLAYRDGYNFGSLAEYVLCIALERRVPWFWLLWQGCLLDCSVFLQHVLSSFVHFSLFAADTAPLHGLLMSLHACAPALHAWLRYI